MERVGKKNERISKEEALGWGRLPKGRWAEGNVQSF